MISDVGYIGFGDVYVTHDVQHTDPLEKSLSDYAYIEPTTCSLPAHERMGAAPAKILFKVIKKNRYGVAQDRYICVNMSHKLIKILGMDLQQRSEFPMYFLFGIQRIDADHFHLKLKFQRWTNHRGYHIFFNGRYEYDMFIELVEQFTDDQLSILDSHMNRYEHRPSIVSSAWNIRKDDISDDEKSASSDEVPVEKSDISRPTHFQYKILKENRYGFSMDRVLTLNTSSKFVQFFHPDLRLDNEFPAAHLTRIEKTVPQENHLKLKFRSWTNHRGYHIYFASKQDYESFIETAENMIIETLPGSGSYTKDNQIVDGIKENLLDEKTPSDSVMSQPSHFSSRLQIPSHPEDSQSSEDQSRKDVGGEHFKNDQIVTFHEISDEEDTYSILQHHIPEFGSPACIQFPVIKKNRFGLGQDRQIVLNLSETLMQILDRNLEIRKEFRIRDVNRIEKTNPDHFHLKLKFQPWALNRGYHIYFHNSLDFDTFIEIAEELIKLQIDIPEFQAKEAQYQDQLKHERQQQVNFHSIY